MGRDAGSAALQGQAGGGGAGRRRGGERRSRGGEGRGRAGVCTAGNPASPRLIWGKPAICWAPGSLPEQKCHLHADGVSKGRCRHLHRAPGSWQGWGGEGGLCWPSPILGWEKTSNTLQRAGGLGPLHPCQTAMPCVQACPGRGHRLACVGCLPASTFPLVDPTKTPVCSSAHAAGTQCILSPGVGLAEAAPPRGTPRWAPDPTLHCCSWPL